MNKVVSNIFYVLIQDAIFLSNGKAIVFDTKRHNIILEAPNTSVAAVKSP